MVVVMKIMFMQQVAMREEKGLIRQVIMALEVMDGKKVD